MLLPRLTHPSTLLANLLLLLLEKAPLAKSLHMVEFKVPEFVNYGQRVTLQCRHHLDYKDGSLHSVKWYKLEPGPGGQDQMINFYTYDPSQQKQKQTKHKGTGLKVLMHQSNEHQVVLKKVKIGSSGRYKCEVMSKKDSHYYSGPPFDAISQVGQMQVVALPSQPPEISGQGSNYAYGDNLDLNCTGEPTYPPTTLSWFINNQQAKAQFVTNTVMKTEDDLYMTLSQLNMRVSSRQFRYGEMRIKCVASITEEPINVDHEEGGLVLEIINLPEAMKLHTENVFEVPVLSGGATLAPALHLLLFLLLPHLLLHLPHLLLHLRHLLLHLVHLPLRLIQGRFVLPFYSHISHFLSNFSHLQHSRM